jgi:DNA-binding LacI/PurR family transcriptional regulator
VIREIAQELGYFPSVAARGLKTNHSQVIGAIVSRIDNPYFGEIVQGIEDTLQQTGYSLFIASSHLDFSSEKNIVRAFAEHRVDGVIICSVTFDTRHADLLKQYGMPIVVVNNQSPEEYRCSIAHDDVDGARQVTRHLLKLGHRRIAYLGNSLAGRINEDRLLGFRTEMNNFGVQVDENLIASAPGSNIENGVEALEILLDKPGLPTAVFCFNDLMAIGVLKLFNKKGIRVPDEISVTGFDNIPYSEFTTPALTTFDQPKRLIGTEAAQMLLNLIQSPAGVENQKQITHTVRGQLLVRESTSAPQVPNFWSNLTFRSPNIFQFHPKARGGSTCISQQ